MPPLHHRPSWSSKEIKILNEEGGDSVGRRPLKRNGKAKKVLEGGVKATGGDNNVGGYRNRQ